MTEEMILALAQSDAKFDGHEHWLGMPRTARERYLERARHGLEAIEYPQLQAKPANDKYDWTDIYPVQLEAMSEAGHKLRAIIYKKD